MSDAPARTLPFGKRQLPRLIVGVGLGTVAFFVTATMASTMTALIVAWVVGVVCFVAWTWLVLYPMSVEETREHAAGEDPGRGAGDAVLVAACVASVFGVGALLLGSSSGGGAGVVDAAVGFAAVAASWFLVPTIFAVRYADLHYGQHAKAMDIGDQEKLAYCDFAYLSFTIAMTYQVSDQTMKTRQARRMTLVQSLLSYFLGVVILGCAVNLVASLAGGG